MVAIFTPSLIIPFLLISLSGITAESTQHSDTNQNDSKTASVESVHGDIYDCIDIHKQPSLDRPDLQDYKIKMTPAGHESSTSSLSSAEDQGNDNIKHILLDQHKLWKSGKGCPKGTVPIPRKTTNSVPTNRHVSKDPFRTSLSSVFHGTEFVGLVSAPDKTFYGASAYINLQNPTKLTEDEYSSAVIYVQGAQNEISVGWTVNPSLYKDYRTRLYTKWLGRNGQGCFNMNCPGFILVNNNIPLDLVFTLMSINGGDQYDVDLAIELDPIHGWWFLLGDLVKGVPIGYWPRKLFDDIQDGASAVRFGGEVMTPASQFKSPPMGTGKYNSGGFNNGTCYMRRVLVIDENKHVMDAQGTFMNIIDNSRDVYFAGEDSFKKDNDFLRYSFLFGGSG